MKNFSFRCWDFSRFRSGLWRNVLSSGAKEEILWCSEFRGNSGPPQRLPPKEEVGDLRVDVAQFWW